MMVKQGSMDTKVNAKKKLNYPVIFNYLSFFKIGIQGDRGIHGAAGFDGVKGEEGDKGTTGAPGLMSQGYNIKI